MARFEPVSPRHKFVLFCLSAPERILSGVRAAVNGGATYVSVPSYWEVFLKSGKRKLDVGDPRSWWTEALNQLAATALRLRSEHVAAMYDLQPIHQDPFDRALIAQAILEERGISWQRPKL